MLRATQPLAGLAFGLLLARAAWAQDGLGSGFNEAAGVNLTAEEGFGARHSGMAVTFAGFHRDADAVANAPAAMNDVDDFTFSSAHAEKFGEAKFDDFAFLIPFEARSTLGLGFARYGVSGIERRPDVPNPETIPAGVFSVADYLVVAGFARRWGGLDVGANLNVLYRHMDQDGWGMRGDLMAQYTVQDSYRLTALVKGLVPAAASWESGYSEYEPTDLLLGAAARFPTPYFYGTLQAAYQSEGLFQKQAKSQRRAIGGRAWSSLSDYLSTGNLGLEFLFDFGMALRVGLTELVFSGDTPSLAQFGIGYSWRKILGLDYSFSPHPDLLSTHRVALQFTPAFPKFNGRGFRTRGNSAGGASALPSREGREKAPSPTVSEDAEKEGKMEAADEDKSSPPTDHPSGEEVLEE